MNYIDCLRVLAMQAVVRESTDYNMRFIARWYSREFATPLHVVESLPTEDVLVHYFEAHYETMPVEDREAEIKKLLRSEEELLRDKLKDDEEDAESFEFAKFTEEAEKRKKNTEQKNFSDAAKAMQKTAQVMHQAIQDFQKEDRDSVTGQSLKEIKQIPPDITMSFIEPDEFEKLIEGDFANLDTE